MFCDKFMDFHNLLAMIYYIDIIKSSIRGIRLWKQRRPTHPNQTFVAQFRVWRDSVSQSI